MNSAAWRSASDSGAGSRFGLLALAAVAGVGALLVNLIALCVVRRGVELDAYLLVLSVLYTTCHMAGATLIALLVGDPLKRILWLMLYQLLAAAFIILVGLFLPSFFYPFILILLAVAGYFARGIWPPRLGAPITALLTPSALMLGFLLVGLVGIAGYQHVQQQTHFFIPEFARLGILHKDPLAFVSFARLILEGYWPGGALDGLQPVVYHFGVQFFFAGLARLTGVSPSEAFVAGQHLILIPLLLFYAALAAVEAARLVWGNQAPPRIIVPLSVGLAIVMPSFAWAIAYYSESSTISAPLLFLSLPLAGALLETRSAHRSRGAGEIWSALALLLVIVLGAAFLKLSVGLLIALMLVAVLLRALLSAVQSTVLYLVCCALSLVLFVAIWPLLFGEPFVVGRLFHRAAHDAVGNEFLWSLGLYAAVLVVIGALGGGGDRYEKIRATADVLLAVLLLEVAAIVAALLIGNAQYLYNARYLFNGIILLLIPLAAVALAGLANRVGGLARKLAPRWGMLLPGLAAVLAFGLFTTLLEHGWFAPSLAVARINSVTARICQRIHVPCRPGDRWLPRALPAATELAINKSYGSRLVAAARTLIGDGAEAFFVPPDATRVWDFLLANKRPVEELLFLPAQLGRPMLLGLPPAARGISVQAVSSAFPGNYGPESVARKLDDKQLCQAARLRHIDKVGIIRSVSPRSHIRLLDCGVRPIE